MSLYIGIDSGTQSTKAVVLDLEQKKVIAEARAPHQLIGGLPVGHMEQHPQDWTDAMDTVIQKVVALVKAQHQKAIQILTDNRAKLDELAQYLYQKETITGDEFMEILNREE
jgi:sugar (pentulose or hexulose) kinase